MAEPSHTGQQDSGAPPPSPMEIDLSETETAASAPAVDSCIPPAKAVNPQEPKPAPPVFRGDPSSSSDAAPDPALETMD